VPKTFYPEIVANESQREEWVRICAIDEVEKDLANPGYSSPLTIRFLEENPFLMLDTKFFGSDFTERLIAGFDDVDEQIDGVCINSENLQALRLIEHGYQGRLRSIYIDPPYNSDAGPISYKNGYRHSSWIALVENRLALSRKLLKDSGILCVTIDDYEAHNLRKVCERSLGEFENLGVVAIKNNPAGRSATVGFSICHEYGFFFGHPELAEVDRLEHSEAQKSRYKEKDEIGFFEWTNFRKHGGVNTYRTTRPRQFYPIYVKGENIRIPKMTWDNDLRQYEVLEKPKANEEVLFPVDSTGTERIWDCVVETARKNIKHFRVRKDSNGGTAIYRKWRINEEGLLPQSWWDKSEYSAPEYGTNLLTKMFGTPHEFMFPKSVYAVADCLRVSGLRNDSSGCVLDYFAGSGTTGHAIINLNREDGGSRKYVLIEVADYFDSVLMKRLKKVIYSDEWREGKPVTRKGSKHFIRYMSLESYEDSLDNIAFQQADESLLKMDDYLLSYMLDFETKDSATLLNVARLDSPFDYKLYRHGKDDPLPVDLPETFKYLIGLHVKTRKVYENKGVRYLVYRGKSDERETVVIWRTTRGWGQKEFDADRAFIAKQKITDGAEDVFVNTDSFVPDARSLDPVFKRRMFNEE
jgi:adenine-specific DNA-methyltransferase